MNFQMNNGEERDDRWKNEYFARYQSPNITIVPTVSFCHPPPRTEPIADPNTNSPTSPKLNCEQLTPVNDNIGEQCASPSRSNCDQQNLQATSSNTSTSTEFSDKFRNSLCVIQDTISTEAPAFNTSQNIQDLSTPKYKSRNNLVDLTGFNLLKREKHSTSSLPKRKDLGQMDDTIEHDNMKTRYDENDHRNYSVSDSYKTDNISKESSTSEKPPSTHSEGNTEYLANGEPRENKTDMEVKMKKYFRQLWKRKFDQLKDKAAKEKHGRAIKSSSKTKQDCKDSKQESSCSKANLQKVSKSYPTKNLKKKIIDSSKKYRNLERRFMGNCPERSKCEINSRHLPDSKVCIRDDFQHFSRHNNDDDDDFNGHEIKYKNENQIKTENLPRKKICLKSCETTTNKPVIKKKVDERKQSIKIEKRNKVNNNQTNLERVENCTDMERAIDQSNTNRVKLIKSVVRVDKNVQNSLSQSKRDRSRNPPGEQDLRSRLSRKRKSEYFVNCHERMENRLDQESLMITVEQDVKVDSKNSPILAPTVNKPKPKKCKQESIMITVKQDVKADSKNSPILAPTVNKPKKCKKIKLTINIECPNSDSDNSDQDFNECCSSPEDLRFLDDFNIDEIVDSLNNSQVEPNKTIKTDNDYKNNEQIKPKNGLINNTSMKAIEVTKKEEITDNDYKNNEQIKPEKGLINNASMKAIEITKKEETSSFIGQVIEVNSDTEDDDMNIEIGSVANTKKCKVEQNIEENSKVDKNTKQEANNITDLSGNGYEENAPKEIIDLCKDEQDIKMSSKVDRNTKQEANNKIDLNGKYSDKNAPKEPINLSDDSNYSVVEVIDITDENEQYMTSKHLQPKKPIQTSTLAKKVNKPSVIRLTGLENANKKSHNTQHEDKTPRITVKQKSHPINITKKKQSQLHKCEDPIEASLQIINKEQNTSVNSVGVKRDVIKKLNTFDKHVKENNDNSHHSEDTVEASLEAMFNNYEQNGSIRKHIEQNKINGCDRKAKENSTQKSVVEVSLESIFNGTKHQDTGSDMDIEQPCLSGQHIRKEIDVLQTAQLMIKVPLEIMNNEDKIPRITVKQKSDPSNITKKKQSQFQKSEDPIEASLQKMFNIEQNKSVNSIVVKSDVIKQLNTLDKHVKEKNDNFHHSEDTVEATLEAMFNNFEQNDSIRKHIEQNKIIGCDREAKQNSIQNGNSDIEQPSLSGQHIRKETDVLQPAPVMIKVPLETTNNKVDQKKNHIIIEAESQQPLPETTKNGIEMNAEIKINSDPLNVSDIIENRSRKSGSISKECLETEENILEKAINTKHIIPLCSSSKNVKKKLQIFEDTVNEPKDKPINNIEKKTNNVISSPPSKNELLFDSGNSTNGTLETAKSFAENCQTSPQIDIKPQNSVGQNNKPKDEPLQKSVETIKTSSKATIDNGEQNTISEANKSVEEKALLPLENLEVKSEKSPERSNIQHKTNATTSVELTIPDKNIEVTSQKTSISKAEKSLMANNKESTLTSKNSNVENQTKSEIVKNNTEKVETIVDASSDLNNVTINDSELGKRSEIATNTKTQQEQVVTNKSLVPDGSKNKDEKISNKKAEIFTTGMKHFLSNLESRMSEYLQKKFIFSSIIHNGRFSTIYKYCGTKGDTYAVKVVRQWQMGKFMEGMLSFLQQYRSRQDSFVLYLMSAVEVQNRWCLLTEYYPINLKQALHGYTNGFHIDQVQILSRQLVDAVNMLTNAGVIHSDIKPTHILLNSAHNRLKLCGFDRSNYSTCINILLSNGTLNYRAPEVILGFQEVHGIDVWSTALVMFEMATNKTLFMGGSNNEILYQQLCTFGSIDWLMVEQSRFRELYFSGPSFVREFPYKNSEKISVVQFMHKNEKLRRTLFQSYERQWARHRTKWQMTRDMNKLESLHTLLEQMLVLNPRNRLPIEFVCGSEFMIHQFT